MANGFADFEYFIFGEISDRFYGIKQYVYMSYLVTFFSIY